MKRITSRHNPIVARFRSVARGETADLLLLDGVHLVLEAMTAGLRIRQVAVATDACNRLEVQDILARLNQLDVDIVTAGASIMNALSPVRSSSPVVAVADRPREKAGDIYRAAPLAIVAVDVQDPGNLGAIVRV